MALYSIMGNQYCRSSNGDVVARDKKISSCIPSRKLEIKNNTMTYDGKVVTNDIDMPSNCVVYEWKNNKISPAPTNITCNLHYAKKDNKFVATTTGQIPPSYQIGHPIAGADLKKLQNEEAMYNIMLAGVKTQTDYNKLMDASTASYTWQKVASEPKQTPTPNASMTYIHRCSANSAMTSLLIILIIILIVFISVVVALYLMKHKDKIFSSGSKIVSTKIG